LHGHDKFTSSLNAAKFVLIAFAPTARQLVPVVGPGVNTLVSPTQSSILRGVGQGAEDGESEAHSFPIHGDVAGFGFQAVAVALPRMVVIARGNPPIGPIRQPLRGNSAPPRSDISAYLLTISA
jgi:hypothetical protein